MDTVKPDWLSHKYFLFCEAYIKTNNASESARQAGYSTKTAGIQGHNLLKHPKIQRYLEERTRPFREQEEEEERQAVASANEVLEYLTSVMRGEIQSVNGFGEKVDASLKDRTTAAQELAKRIVDTEQVENPVKIVIDIPRPEPKKEETAEEEVVNESES